MPVEVACGPRGIGAVKFLLVILCGVQSFTIAPTKQASSLYRLALPAESLEELSANFWANLSQGLPICPIDYEQTTSLKARID